MEYQYPKFTPEMKKTHTILIPNMAITQFRLLEYALRYDGYKCEILGNCGSAVAQLGLKYVHNDTCYPALLVIGQFLDALNSGKYDLDHTALLITQTGGGCRASNYIFLLRKALEKAGYGNIPVLSLNFSGLEKGSGLPLTVPLLRKARDVSPQSRLRTPEERRANISGCYVVRSADAVRGKRILLIDDVITTGSTLSECARMLLTAGAVSVRGAALACHREE